MLSTRRDGTSTLGAVSDHYQPAHATQTGEFHLNQLAPSPNPRRRLPVWLTTIVVLSLGLGAGSAAYLLTEPGSGTITFTSGQAKQKCRTAVAQQLKAPGSAKYGDEQYTSDTPTAGRVTGWVDAQNGFGALVRNRFVCGAQLGETGWIIGAVEFTDW